MTSWEKIRRNINVLDPSANVINGYNYNYLHNLEYDIKYVKTSCGSFEFSILQIATIAQGNDGHYNSDLVLIYNHAGLISRTREVWWNTIGGWYTDYSS